MCADNGLNKICYLQSLQLTNAVDEDLLALISNLIDQISELQKRLQELNSWKELADKVLEQAYKRGDEIRLRAEKEVQDRAAATISEAERKAKLEADRIIAEAKQKSEDIAKETIQSAIYQGSEIIDKAQERYQLIVEDAKRKADEIYKGANQKVKRR
jgi:vacuolar-type H+-ATPase subunit H